MKVRAQSISLLPEFIFCFDENMSPALNLSLREGGNYELGKICWGKFLILSTFCSLKLWLTNNFLMTKNLRKPSL